MTTIATIRFLLVGTILLRSPNRGSPDAMAPQYRSAIGWEDITAACLVEQAAAERAGRHTTI
jgi:hypothetical protein